MKEVRCCQIARSASDAMPYWIKKIPRQRVGSFRMIPGRVNKLWRNQPYVYFILSIITLDAIIMLNRNMFFFIWCRINSHEPFFREGRGVEFKHILITVIVSLSHKQIRKHVKFGAIILFQHDISPSRANFVVSFPAWHKILAFLQKWSLHIQGGQCSLLTM